MSCATTAAAAAPTRAAARPARRLLAPRAAFLLQASITLSFLAGSSAPTPLYALYQAAWGFSPTMLTFVFGIYAIAVLIALLVAGRLSDHVGRRPVLMAAAAAQAVTMLVFATAGSLAELLLGRVLQGLSAGAVLAAVGAGLLDIDKTRGAVANAVAPLLGTALGGVVAGLMVQYLPAPTHLVYAVLGAVFVAQCIGVAFIAETAQLRAGALASLKPQFSVPAAARGPLLLVVPVVMAVWALAGFYASLGPTLVHTLFASNSILLGGLALFVLAGSGALAVLGLRRCEPQVLVRIGAVALLGGLAVAMAALSRHSVLLFLLGTTIAGTGVGAGFQGALRTIVARIAPHERAGVISVLLVISYLSLGVPAIVAGYRLAQYGDILARAREFGAVAVVLAVIALLGTTRTPA